MYGQPAYPPQQMGQMPPMGGYGQSPVFKEKARGYGINQMNMLE